MAWRDELPLSLIIAGAAVGIGGIGGMALGQYAIAGIDPARAAIYASASLPDYQVGDASYREALAYVPGVGDDGGTSVAYARAVQTARVSIDGDSTRQIANRY